ncbi:MAG: GNAT family N-acetyltransferase [Alphaproteobacteria bacterium]|nr:GNAT family N-acetyltransferase [Alphaproteobacteria bacterium]
MAVIVPLREAHVPAAARLIAEAFNTAAADERKSLAGSFNAAVAPRAFTFAALESENVVGVIRLMSYGVPQGWGDVALFSIFQFAVDPARRGRGVGHALMRHAEDFAAAVLARGQNGCITLLDETKRGRPDSRFYEKQGYASDAGRVEEGLPVLYKYVSRPRPQIFSRRNG